MMKLYSNPMSRGSRPLWMLEEVGAPYELINLDFAKAEHKTPSYLKIHPMGLLPAFQDGNMTMFESGAIVAYLADKFPEKHLAPATTSPERAHYYQWLFFVCTTLEEPIVKVFLHTMRLEEGKRKPDIAEEGRVGFHKAAQVLSDALSKNPYILGKEFSAADILVSGALELASHMKLLSDFPVLQEYLKRQAERPALQRARAKTKAPGA